MITSFVCQVDHIAMHRHGMFAFGWAMHPARRICAAHAALRFADGHEQRVRVSVDRPREDVAAAFPNIPHAANSGYMLIAGWNEAEPTSVSLQFDIAGGPVEIMPLSFPRQRLGRRRAAVTWRYLVRRSWAHARTGRFRVLWKKISDYRRRSSAGSKRIDEPALAEAIAGRPCTLIIDHSMGGGANAFRDRLADDLAKAGDTVVVLTFAVAQMTLAAEVRTAGAAAQAVPTISLDGLSQSLKTARLTRIIYNCAVSFPQPLDIRSFILSLQRSTAAALIVAIHDYFVVCPSSYLLDSGGRYCGVPGIERCRRCLPAHDDGFVSLAGERSIDRWRAAWGEVLRAADEVRCFSESSRRLLERAYPGITARIHVTPHVVDPLQTVHIADRANGPLVIGVIGSISHHKGAAVVASLAQAIQSQHAAAKIVVLGHVDAACPPEVVEEVGAYDRKDLPRLVERHSIDVALLPSICPETFSFVAHEVLAMGLPLMTLDLGAQADLARSHPLGRVAMTSDGPELLAELLAFANDLQPRRRERQGAVV